MTTTLSEGVKVPDVGSTNWAGDLEVNWNLLNGALANLSGNVKTDRDNTWTGEQSFTLPIVGSITGTASKAIADEDGTSIKTGYVNVAGNQTVTGDKSFTGSNTFNNILPNATNTYSLGSSSYQWSSVYARAYYYNGTEFSSKFVTTDTQQVITGFKIFNTGSWIRTPQTIDPTTDPSSFISGNGIAIWDNAEYWGSIEPHWTTDGIFRLVFGLSCFSTSETRPWSALSIDATKNNQALNLVPHHNNANLGTSTNQWKTLNGINPGALSLPDVSKSVTVDIPVDWVTDGSAWNALNVSNMGDGWLSLTYRLCGASDYILARLGGTNANTYPSMLFPATLLGDSKYYIFAFLPVTKAMGNIRLEINLTSGSVVVNHSFYPCLGNV